MAKQIQLRRGTTTEHNTFTGAVGELTYDTEKKQLRVHDGSTVGGTVMDVDECLKYMPIPYPKSTPPQGYLAMMGQTISQATYPKLYGLYGAILPDLRAYTIRGLDNGRGIDANRTILSEQDDAIRNIVGSFKAVVGSSGEQDATSGVFSVLSNLSANLSSAGGDSWARKYEFNASRVVPTAPENRVKNIAFNYIVKAG